MNIVDDFHKLVYSNGMGGITYMGIPIRKWPCDLHLYQELIWATKPDYLIETGTAFGGSALYYAHLFDQIGKGLVITIDRDRIKGWTYATHPRIWHWTGRSSTHPQVINTLQDILGGDVMVSLDSDHSKDHVLRELECYSAFVTPGSYLIVEDTNLNGNPVYPDHGPGPREALDEWLGPNIGEFLEDLYLPEKFQFSFNSWLMRL